MNYTKKINWCKKQKKGIKLIEPNNNISNEYFNTAEESLRVLKAIWPTQSRIWLATTNYYIEYFAVYSVLMKIGIKCEIHDCTIELANFLEKEGIIEKSVSTSLKKDKGLRTDNQYYLKNKAVDINFEKLAKFLLSIKLSIQKLDSNKIKEIRDKLNKL